ncbi:hypothetical protein LENED_005347 [Lentinula edodes]|uniref:Uncharacterized protein n=1 Tax=Lentinula edodes TaxID=5353 RepID=A0A1Q3E8Q5_LENED|nr:hypothetical protein LENED_005347 [Lentinula edodes]
MNSVTVFSVGSSEAFSLLSSVWTSSSSVDSDDATETSPGPTDQENESSASSCRTLHIAAVRNIDDTHVLI